MYVPYSDFCDYFSHVFVAQVTELDFPFSQLIEADWAHPYNQGYGSAMNPQFAFTFANESDFIGSGSRWIRFEMSIPSEFVDKCGISLSIVRKPLIPGTNAAAVTAAGKRRIESFEPSNIVAHSVYHIGQHVSLEYVVPPSDGNFWVVIPSFGTKSLAISEVKNLLVPFRLSVLSRQATKLFKAD